MITKLVVAAALASAAAATGGVVLITSGPLANHTTDNRSATATSLAGTVTAGPTKIPITPTTLAGPLRPDDLFDFSALPPVTQSGWTTYSAPNGTFTFRAPADWVVRMGPIQPPNGPPLGDAADIRKPGSDGASIGPGVTASGWLEVAISTQPFQVDFNLAGFETTVRTDALQRQTPSVGAASPSRISVIQVKGGSAAPKYRGAMIFTTPSFKPKTLFLNTVGIVHFDADPTDVATVIRIIESVEVLQ